MQEYIYIHTTLKKNAYGTIGKLSYLLFVQKYCQFLPMFLMTSLHDYIE